MQFCRATELQHKKEKNRKGRKPHSCRLCTEETILWLWDNARAFDEYLKVFITGHVHVEVVYWAYSGKIKPICIDGSLLFGCQWIVYTLPPLFVD